MGVHHGQAGSDLSQQLSYDNISILLPLEGIAGCLGHSCVRLPSARRAAAIAYAVGPVTRGLGRLPMDLLGRCRACTVGACMIYRRCSSPRLVLTGVSVFLLAAKPPGSLSLPVLWRVSQSYEAEGVSLIVHSECGPCA